MSLSQAAILAPAFQLDPLIDGFFYGPGLAGASFMAVQERLHGLDTFDAMATTAQDHTVLGL